MNPMPIPTQVPEVSVVVTVVPFELIEVEWKLEVSAKTIDHGMASISASNR